jgi:pilus assembly protein Flp/PilA
VEHSDLYAPIAPACNPRLLGESAMFPKAWVMDRARRFWNEEDGPTAVEYAILLALIVLVAAATIQSIGERMYNIYVNINGVMP